MNKIKKGDKFLCIKNVEMNGKKDDISYIKGKEYISEFDKCITNELGNKYHFWHAEELEGFFEKINNSSNKIKLVSGKEVELGDTVWWVVKKSLDIRKNELHEGMFLNENDICSEAFATKEEAEEWLENYKQSLDRFWIDKVNFVVLNEKQMPLLNNINITNYSGPYKTSKEADNYLKILIKHIPENLEFSKKSSLEDNLKDHRRIIYSLPDNIKPNYYKSKSGQDVLDVIEDFDMDFYTANIFKYIIRYKEKNGLEDLKKANEYLQRKIKNLENGKNN